jgi:hypothetical protein
MQRGIRSFGRVSPDRPRLITAFVNTGGGGQAVPPRLLRVPRRLARLRRAAKGPLRRIVRGSAGCAAALVGMTAQVLNMTHRPYSWCRPRVRRSPSSHSGSTLKKNRGRAGRFGPRRTRVPRRLAASERITLGRSHRHKPPQVRQTQGVPRTVFNRSAPRRPRWTSRFRP